MVNYGIKWYFLSFFISPPILWRLCEVVIRHSLWVTANYFFDCSYKKLNIKKKKGRRSVIVLNSWFYKRRNISHIEGIISGKSKKHNVSQTCAILFQIFVSKTQMIGLFEKKLCCFEYNVVDLGIWVSKKKRKNDRNFKQRKDYKYQRWWGQRNLTQVPWEYYKIKMPWTDSKHKHAYMNYLTDSVRPTAKWRNEVR